MTTGKLSWQDADVQVVTSHEWQPLMLSVKIKAVKAQ